MMTRSQSKILQDEALERLISATSGLVTVAELRELKAWRARSPAHAAAYRQALSVWTALGEAASESVTPQDRAMIAGTVSQPSGRLGRRAFLAGGGLAAAGLAGVALIKPPLDLWPSLDGLMADYRTETGERRTLDVADGISVEMNTRTSIARRPSVDDVARIELIAGEAAISATSRDAGPMTVLAATGEVTLVAGAQVNLRFDGDVVRVACLDGFVRVACVGNAVQLASGEQLAYSRQGLSSIAAVDASAVEAWRRGLLIFRDEPLARVVDEVNRYWHGRIILLNADLGHRRVTVRVELARIGEVISYVRSVMGAGVRTLPGGVVLLT